MKRDFLKTIICICVSSILVCSCKQDIKPEEINPDALRVLTIAQLKDMNTGIMTAKVKIPAMVMSSGDNIESNLFTIQDGNESKDGILIDAKASHGFAYGTKVLLNVEGCEFTKRDNYCIIKLPELSYVTKESSSDTPFSAVMIDKKKLAIGNYQSMYVGLDGFEVIDDQLNATIGGTLNFVNKQKDTIKVVTSSKATFANYIVSKNSGIVKGVVSLVDEEYVLLPQSSSDFDLTAKRFKLSGDNNAIVVWTDNTSLNAYVAECTNNEIEGAVSLDEDGTQSANCFVVSKPGKYSFYAKDASGKYPAGIEEDTILYIDVTAVGGNSVVGYVSPDTKQLLWTWHIWASSTSLSEMSLTRETTATDNEATTSMSIVMLDRLLGAGGITPGTTQPHGLYYQWGRKDPMIGVSTIGQWVSKETESESELGGAATSHSVVNKTYVAEWNYSDGTEETATHQGGASVPTTFITLNYPSLNDEQWAEVANPCPYGYHVPSIQESKAVLGVNAKITYTDLGMVFNADGTTEGMDVTKDLGCTLKDCKVWFPNNGDRAKKKGRMLNLGRNHYSWCNTLSGSSGYMIQITNTQLNPEGTFNRGNATGVRCVKDFKVK